MIDSPATDPEQTDETPDPTGMLTRDVNRFRTAGNKMAIAAMHVIDHSDGLHRLALAVADWNLAVANEGDRPHPDHASPSRHEAVIRNLMKRVLSEKSSNELDVLIEVALFEPDETYQHCRPNNARTKVIYTKAESGEITCWARTWSAASMTNQTYELLRKLL